MSNSSRISAFLAYLLPVFSWAYVFAARKDDKLAVFHTWQAIGIFGVALVTFIAWVVFGWLISFIPYIGFITMAALFSLVMMVIFVMSINWVFGMTYALRAKLKPLPISGPLLDRLSGRQPAGAQRVSYSHAMFLYQPDLVSPIDDVTITVIGFGRRLMATVIDAVLLAVAIFTIVIAVAFVSVIYIGFQPDETVAFFPAVTVLGLICSIGYYVGFWAKSGQTIGLSIVGIKVVSADGSPISIGQAIVRYIGYIISGLLFSIGFIWLAFDKKRQGWHDKLAKTLVVDEDDRFYNAHFVEYNPSDPGKSWVWLAVWLGVGLVTPAGFLSGLWALGPFMDRFIQSLF